jgi:hypothetical protein
MIPGGPNPRWVSLGVIEGAVAMSSPRLDLVDRDLIVRKALTYSIRGRRREPLWSLVASICGVGSTSGTEICRELGWDPNQEAGKPLPRD